MKGHFYKPNCKCEKGKKCTCGATWAYMIDVGRDQATGRRKQKKKGGFATKKEAQEAANRIMLEVVDGTYIEEKNISFERFAKKWLEMYKNSGRVKPSTWISREKAMKRLLRSFGDTKIKKITRTSYQSFLDSLLKKGYASNTIISTHITGSLIFKKALELEIIKNDPTAFCMIPKKQKTVEELENATELPKYMEKEQLLAFLEAAKIYGLFGDYPAFLTLSHTGVRIGELCALKWKDIDFDKKTISITKTLFCPSSVLGGYQLLTPKTKSSKRVIDISQEVANVLLAYRAAQNEIKMKFRKTYVEEGFVFIRTNKGFVGYCCDKELFRQRAKRLFKILGLERNFTLHSFRHTHTSLLAAAGASLEVIMERLGHSNDTITRTIYLHVTKSQKKEAAQIFEKYMKS